MHCNLPTCIRTYYRELILLQSEKMELLKRNYVNQLTNALRDQQKYNPGSPEVYNIVSHIIF